MSDSIKVAIKVRPLIKREKDENLPVQWEVQGNRIFSVDPETKRRGEQSHIFDHIFDMKTNNSDVYEGIVRPIVDATVNGFNGTIFAYGQTSSGKTHTMMGTANEPGVIPLAVENMFDAIANTSGREFLLRVSYLEIYNEKVNDLLHEDGTDLKIKEDVNGQVYVQCKEEVTNCPQNVLSIMKKGDKKRRIGETNMNERSSRSHTIFRITIESRESGSDNADGAVQVSQLNLVDLAGSERARQTGATGDRFKEGRHINMSLSALGLVIMQLSESQEFINFRDSKLTRILQTSLGGNAMTTIICAVTPAALDETQCTLAFAARAKSVKNKPKLNEVMSDEALLKRYSKQIAKLSAELKKSKQTSQFAQVEEMQSKLQEKDRHIQLIEGRMELLKTRIVSGANSVENVDFKTKSRRRRTWGGPSISGLLNHSLALPTIQETSAAEDVTAESNQAKFKRRQSIIQTPVNDIVNEKFQTQVEDFELELIESERNWEMGRFSTDSIEPEDNFYVSRRRSGGNHVKFQDDVSVHQISYADSYNGSPVKSEPLTPPRRSQEQDSGTPKEVLRERISHLMDEYTSLKEFTTLEKQLYFEEAVVVKPDNMEALVNHMKRSVSDSEMMCLESNKKYSDLQDKYTELEKKYETTVQDHAALKEQVEKLSGMEESLRIIELEKKQLKLDMETKIRRLKKLEEERNDYEYQIELLESKHKTREKELESSLQIAWTDFTDTADKEKFSNILHLQSLVESLTKEVEALKNISNESEQPMNEQLQTENELILSKVEEYNTLLSTANNENIKLMQELNELKSRLTCKPDLSNNISSNGEHEIIDSCENDYQEGNNAAKLNEMIKDKESIIEENEKLKTKIAENSEQLKNNMSLIDSLKVDIDNLKLELAEKNSEFANIKTKFEELHQIQSQMDSCVKEKLTDDNSTKISSLENELQTNKNEIEEYKSKAISLDEEIGKKSEEITTLKGLVNELNTNNENLQLKFDSLREELDRKNATENEFETNKNEIEDYKSKAISLNEEIRKKLDEISTLNSLVNELNTNNENLQLKFDSLHEELDRKNATGKEFTTNQNDIEEYKSKVISLNEEIGKKSNEITTLNGLVNELSTNNENLQLKFDSLREELDQKTAIIEDLIQRTESIHVPVDEVIQNFTQPSAENYCPVGIELVNKIMNENEEAGELDVKNSATETAQNCLETSLSQIVNNGLDNDVNDLQNSSPQIEKMETCAIIDAGEDNVCELKAELEKLIVENANLLKENDLLKSQMIEFTIEKDSEVSHAEKMTLEAELARRDSKLCELQNDIQKLRDQIITMQSEKTLYKGEKCAMQKIANENEEIIQQVPKLEAEIKDLKQMNEEFERTILELRTNLNTKSLELESISTEKYESKIQSLKSYVENLQQFNKNIQIENEDLKNQLHNQSLNLENDLDDLRRRVAEQEQVTHTLEEDKKTLTKRIAELSPNKSAQSVTTKSDSACAVESGKDKLSEDTKEYSSIFANASYFDEMDVSMGQDATMEDITVNASLSDDDKQSSDVKMLRSRIHELEIENQEFQSKSTTGEHDVSNNDTINKLHELMNINTLLEDENARVRQELRMKIQESIEIGNDVQGLKLDIGKLNQTIHLLTTENMDMSSKLTIEKDRAKEAEAAYQIRVEDFYQRISKITKEKVSLESELKIFQEQLDNLRANTPTGTEDEVREKIEKYQQKIDSLTTENIELSTSLMDKIEELDKIKESKALLYDHECSYKDEAQELKQKLEELNQENIDLSSNLMEKIEESDSLRNAYELLENKLTVSVRNQLSTSINTTQNEVTELKTQNSQLKSENIDLVAKVTTLSNENTKFSDNLLEAMAALDNSRLCQAQATSSETLLDRSKNSESFSAADDSLVIDDNIQTLKNKLQAYQLQVNQLTRLNKKLSDLKLSSCAQCTHLKELNDSRRTLKLEVRSLNHKLQDLQKKFEQKCADTEILRNKACEELSLSVVSDAMMLNGSMSECMNVTFVEEKVQSLNNELATLKQNYEQLSSTYKDKCSEVEKLHEMNPLEESMTEVESPPPVSKNNRARIERVQSDIDKLREEIQLLKKRNTTLSESLNKFMSEKSRLQTEIDTLKECKDDLNTKLQNSEMQIEMANGKVSILESEVTDLNKLVESLRIIEREATNDRLNFEVEIESLKTERLTHHKAIEELRTSLNSEKENNSMLQKDLEELKNANDLAMKSTKAIFNESLQKHSSSPEKIEESKDARQSLNFEGAQNGVEDLKQSLAKLSEENVRLLSQIETMRQNPVVVEKELSMDYSTLNNEIETAKQYITREIRSLKPEVEFSELSNKTVQELLVDFLKIVMMKEQEIIKTVQDRFEGEKQNLEDAKRQSVDAERRITMWAKELETDIEKLQADLLSQEEQNIKLQRDIERLENDLKESNYEKQLLKEKTEVLETDFNGLQAELAKQSDVDNKQGKEVNAIQERERLALASAKNREIELQNSIKSMKDQHNKKVEELSFALENYKTKNLELKSNFEGLEANERQLKSIIDVKSMDLAKLHQRTVSLEKENMQMSEMSNQLNQDNRNKDIHIEEITNLLKIKCDKLSEYKTKLESIVPEYEILKDQIKERKQYAERYKKEYEGLRVEAEKELNLIKDQLSDEQIKTTSLSEQLSELNNKNKVLVFELTEMKCKCEELEQTNERLLKKIRNSTSNSRVEAQIEDLKDQNAMLKKNVEGASNRITELQETKNSITKDLILLQGKYEMLSEEKKELEKNVELIKLQSNASTFELTALVEKLEAQIQEKNKIALELEATKLSVARTDKELIVARQEIDSLRNINKELNEENEELATEVQERIVVAENLRSELYEHKYSSNNENAENQNQNTKAINDTTEVEILIQQNKELRTEFETLSKAADSLKKENSELKTKVTELELRTESKSCSSSRSASPLLENNRRKQRRSDLYNQSRGIEDSNLASTVPINCRCTLLAQKVRELELEIVSKNGLIATLELQIQSESFPYQKKCKDLEENLLAFRNKNMVLKEEVRSLRRAISSTTISECEICRRRQTNKRDQSTQCLPEQKTFLSGTSSGIVDDYAKIIKLEKEKSLMRDLCRSRTRHIKDLQKQISEYEAIIAEQSKILKTETTVAVDDSRKNMSNENIKALTKPQVFGENNKRAMKENLSTNILDNASSVTSNRSRSLWSHYP